METLYVVINKETKKIYGVYNELILARNAKSLLSGFKKEEIIILDFKKNNTYTI